MSGAAAWTKHERETVVTTSDGDELVHIWTAQLHVIRRMSADKRFTPVDSGDGWASFTIPRERWSPLTGAKRAGHRKTPEQRAAAIAALARGRDARILAADTSNGRAAATNGPDPVGQGGTT